MRAWAGTGPPRLPPERPPDHPGLTTHDGETLAPGWVSVEASGACALGMPPDMRRPACRAT